MSVNHKFHYLCVSIITFLTIAAGCTTPPVSPALIKEQAARENQTPAASSENQSTTLPISSKSSGSVFQIMFLRWDSYSHAKLTLPWGKGSIVTPIIDGNGHYQIYLINNDGSNDRKLTTKAIDYRDTDWSPDKHIMVFEKQTDYGNTSIFLSDENGDNERELTPDAAYYQFPNIAPDGKRIVYCKSRTAPTGWMMIVRHDIYIMNIDGSGKQRITDVGGQDIAVLPKWFPDGKRITYLRTDYGYYFIESINIETGEVKRYSPQINIPFNQGDSVCFDISPDGKTIVYSADKSRVPYNDFREIFTIDLDSQVVSQLTDNEFEDDSPCWSPDGRQIIFGSLRDLSESGESGIYTMRPDGTEQSKIAGTHLNGLVAGGGGYYVVDSPLKCLQVPAIGK